MAIIVPILLSYTGAAAAIGTAVGISATAVTAIASVAFQVSGINNKINQAAAKVFGEDLVMIANVAGAVYGAVNGGFGGGGGEAAGLTEAGGALSTKAMLDGTNAFGVNSAIGAFDLADTAGALGSATDASSLWATNGMDAADNAFNLANKAAGGGLVSDGVGVNLLNPEAPMQVDAKPAFNATSSAADELANRSQGASSSFQSGAASQTAAGQNASGMKASSGQQLKAGDITKGVEAPKTPAVNTAATKPGSFFDKLLSNDKAAGEVIKGVGAGISGAANAKAEEKSWHGRSSATATPPPPASCSKGPP